LLKKGIERAFGDSDKQNMIGKILIILRTLINILIYIATGIWSLLTIIVIFAFIHRWTNPGLKSISNHDLKDYGLITGFFLLIIGFLFFARFFIKKQSTSKQYDR